MRTKRILVAALATLVLGGCSLFTEPEDSWSRLAGNWVSSNPISNSAQTYRKTDYLRLTISQLGTGSWSFGGYSSPLTAGTFANNSVSFTLVGSGPGGYSALLTATYKDDRIEGVLSGATSQFDPFNSVPVVLVRGN